MHVLVTGGAGFIGAHSARQLLQAGHRVTVVDDLSHGRREAVPPGAKLVVLDVRSPGLPSVLEPGVDAVLHLAAQMDVRRSVADPLYDASINVLGTLNALEAARQMRVRRFVFASSGGAIYGEQDEFPARESHPRRPASPYGVSKLCGEEYVAHYGLAHGMSVLALRYANVYGPGQDPHGEAGVVAIFLNKLLSGETAVINGDGLQTRDYVYATDVARANLRALESDVSGALNVGTGVETTVVELAHRLAAHAGVPAAFVNGPAKPGEQRRSCIDPRAARELLGWAPEVDLEQGLAATAASFRSVV
ncbi:MAG TPA: NAD-dependent epimerase/dehydratase family protein [Myxococcales bacterium]